MSSFLEKMKAMNSAKEAGATIAAKPNPFAKPAPVVTAPTVVSEVKAEVKIPVNPFAKKTEVKEPASTPEPVIDQIPAVPETPEEIIDFADEVPVEAAPVEVVDTENTITLEDAINQEEVVIEQESQPSEKKEVVKQKRTRKTAKAEAEEGGAEELQEMDYDSAVSTLFSVPFNQEWEDFKKEVEKEMEDTVISSDMNPGTLVFAISKLDSIRQFIYQKHFDTKALIEMMGSDKPEGLIERVKRKASIGNNVEERRRNGVIAAENYGEEGCVINLYEVLDQARIRFAFLDGTMNTIDYKNRALITMNGALKLDNSLLK